MSQTLIILEFFNEPRKKSYRYLDFANYKDPVFNKSKYNVLD